MNTPRDASTGPRFILDRRTFLLGAATTGLVAACGGSSDGGASGGSAAAEPFSVVQRFPSNVTVPGEVRLPISIAQAAEFITDGPDELIAQVYDLDGNSIGDEITAVRRDTTPSPYYAFRTTIDTPDIYELRVAGGPDQGANFQVMERSQVAVPGPGDQLAGFDTPTPDDPRGVDPICTREPVCPFHTITLTEALATGKPVAYIVGTPAFCQTGTCAPALETAIGVAPEYADEVVFVHAEAWTDLTATEIAPAVVDLDMQFEPTMIIVGADGAVIERLDGLWDATELREQLDLVIS